MKLLFKLTETATSVVEVDPDLERKYKENFYIKVIIFWGVTIKFFTGIYFIRLTGFWNWQWTKQCS